MTVDLFSSTASGTGCPGTLTELIAVGACDAYLTVDADTTFWKTDITRYTNFACEHVRIDSSSGSCSFGSTQTFTLEKCGDLVSKVYAVFQLPGIRPQCQGSGGQLTSRFPSSRSPDDNALMFDQTLDTDGDGFFDEQELHGAAQRPWVRWTNAVGYALVENASLCIGSQTICSTYGTYLDLFDELTYSSDRRPGAMVGKYHSDDEREAASAKSQTLYVPLGFYFEKTSTKALPVVAMRFHRVSVSLKLRSLGELIETSGPNVEVALQGCNNLIQSTDLTRCELLVKYVFLDLAERDRFAVSTFVTLFQQVSGQEVTVPAGQKTVTVDLTCNGPVAELLWVGRRSSALAVNDHFNYSGVDDNDPIVHASLTLNGAARFNAKCCESRMVVPFESHNSVPDKHVYCYSFALDPESPHATGSLNFSRIDRARMTFVLADDLVASGDSLSITIFSSGWNVLSVGNGMASARFSS
jgi:hypothetical protein